MSHHEVGTRGPNSTGRWHLIAYDDTYCGYIVYGDWVTCPLEQLARDNVCGTCRRAAGLDRTA